MAIAIAERSFGSTQVKEPKRHCFSCLHLTEYLTFVNIRDVESEIIQILLNREADVIQIIKPTPRESEKLNP